MPSKEQSICEGIQWVDVSNPTPGDMQELSQRFGLNELLLRDCLQPEHLPKYEYVDEVHFLILRYYSKEADKKVSTIQELTNKIALFYTGRFLITIHISHPLFLETIRVKFVHAGRCTSVTDVLSRIVWNALETFDDPGNRLSEQV
ncbi:MAG TPA: CorA family divalent cation transporter, partial [Chitinophagaceae bacterium]|nr:CorA family divalent cation transporter [Chitinophagaceae bacterium]